MIKNREDQIFKFRKIQKLKFSKSFKLSEDARVGFLGRLCCHKWYTRGASRAVAAFGLLQRRCDRKVCFNTANDVLMKTQRGRPALVSCYKPNAQNHIRKFLKGH